MLTANRDTSRADDRPPASFALAICRRILAVPAALLIAFVRVYQWTLSPFIGRQCRFAPTCSEYFIQAVQKYGAIAGSWRGVRRILRCHPWHPGGYDPP